MISGFRSRCTVNSTDDTLSRESFQEGSGVNAKKAGNWNTAIGDENFLSGAGAIDPFAEVGSQVAHSYVHLFSVQPGSIHLYVSSMFLGTRHPSKHPSQRSDGARQNRQGTTENPVNIDNIDHRRPMTTDRLPFTLSRSGVRVPQRPPQRPPFNVRKRPVTAWLFDCSLQALSGTPPVRKQSRAIEGALGFAHGCLRTR